MMFFKINVFYLSDIWHNTIAGLSAMTGMTQPNWTKCICHVTDSREKLSEFTQKSCKKFVEFSERRKDDIWI